MHITLKGGDRIQVHFEREGLATPLQRALFIDSTGYPALGATHPQASSLKVSTFDADDPHYIRINLAGRQFAYQNPDGADVGDRVAVRLPGATNTLHTALVCGRGKGSYTGTPYKAARLVPEGL